MAVVAYWRIETPNGNKISFICGKTKCAPTRHISIPKLELQAAVFASRLKTKILESYCVKPSRIFLWTDSTTVIRWIHSDTRKYKQFVANRVGEILKNTSISYWRWLPGSENPADDATRPVSQYNPEGRWKNGPPFLFEPESSWPTLDGFNHGDESDFELRAHCYALSTITVSVSLIDFSRFSNYRRLIRSLAWALRFVNNLRLRSQSIGDRKKDALTVEEEEKAEVILCHIVQSLAYHNEHQCLQRNKPVSLTSDLKTLCPFIDKTGLMRVQGRIDNAIIVPYGTRRPIILPKKHRFTQLLVLYYHQKLNHLNTDTLINKIREKYWIPSIRVVVKSVQSKCCICKIRRASPTQPIMGQLPPDRVTPFVRPFSFCGLDYFGPIEVTIRRQREKRWIALFTCLTIRAVHLEVATSLSSDSCLMCIKNFVNRRGVPKQIRSDNGTNFVGLRKELAGEDNFFDNDAISTGLSPLGIKWKYNTPADPAAGGVWERLVQSVKRSLYAALKEHAPRPETLYSILVETENIVNSRPLTHIPVTPEEPEPLTPNHFLIGFNNSSQTPAEYNHRLCSSRKQWRILQNVKNHIWKRWIKEYLPELTRRSKRFRSSSPLQTGSLVLICDANEARSNWKRGRIMKLVIGKYGVARSAQVKTTSGMLSRPVSKLAILDVCGESSDAIHGGGEVADEI